MNDQNNYRYIRIMNMTNLYTRDLKMYSLGDIRLGGGVSLKKVAYTTAFILLWSIPLILIFGIQLNVYYAAIVIIPPILLGHFASKPVFGGKNLIDFLTTMFNYISEPFSWTDLRENRERKPNYYVSSEIWISRRRELQYLADLKEKEIEEQKSNRIPTKSSKSKRKNKKQKV